MKKVSQQEFKQKREELFSLVENENLSIGQFVRMSRKATGRTQVEYAKAMNIEVKTLSAIENDKANITLKTVEKLLKPWGMQLTVKK